MTAEVLLSRLEKVRQYGSGQWMARCPAHDDRNPSLSIKEADDGVVLIKCFGHCAPIDVLGAIGLTFADLFPALPAGEHRGRPTRLPRLNGWAVVDAIDYRLTCITLAATELERGKMLNPADFATLHDSIMDVQAAITEARRAR